MQNHRTNLSKLPQLTGLERDTYLLTNLGYSVRNVVELKKLELRSDREREQEFVTTSEHPLMSPFYAIGDFIESLMPPVFEKDYVAKLKKIYRDHKETA